MAQAPQTIRLQRFLAHAGVAARRKAETLITAGRVAVNGKVVSTLGSKVDPKRDKVTVDRHRVSAVLSSNALESMALRWCARTAF